MNNPTMTRDELVAAAESIGMRFQSEPGASRPYNPTHDMLHAAKRIDPALTMEQARALWSAMWTAAPSAAPVSQACKMCGNTKCEEGLDAQGVCFDCNHFSPQPSAKPAGAVSEDRKAPSDTNTDFADLHMHLMEVHGELVAKYRELKARARTTTRALRMADMALASWENGHAFDPHGPSREAQRLVTEALASESDSPARDVTDDEIRTIFLNNGFTIKDGQGDLKPYVYAAARELLATAQQAERGPDDEAAWKLVPVEPTKTMLVLGENGLHRASHGDFVATEAEIESCWRAMLAASPKAPLAAQGEPVVAEAAGLTDARTEVRRHLRAFHAKQCVYPIAELHKAYDAVDALAAIVQGAPVVAEAVSDVMAERQRQIGAEGWTPEHDDEHGDGSLARAAACYALGTTTLRALPRGTPDIMLWPWSPDWWKPADARRNLVKAGALIIAEIERMDRAAATQARKDQS